MKSTFDKLIAKLEKPEPTSQSGRYNRRKAIKALYEGAVADEVKAISADSSPRCGTCGRACDPWNDSDEGYSHCCNDRIEYAGEWLDKPDTILEWARDRVNWRVYSGTTDNLDILRCL